MGLSSLSVMPRFEVLPDHLESDGVHLTPAAGALYLTSLGNFIRSEVESDLTLIDNQIDIADSSDDDDMSVAPDNDEDKLAAILKVVTSNSKRLGSIKPLKATLERLSSSIC